MLETTPGTTSLELTDNAADQGVLLDIADAGALALLHANFAAVVCAAAAELAVQLHQMIAMIVNCNAPGRATSMTPHAVYARPTGRVAMTGIACTQAMYKVSHTAGFNSAAVSPCTMHCGQSIDCGAHLNACAVLHTQNVVLLELGLRDRSVRCAALQACYRLPSKQCLW